MKKFSKLFWVALVVVAVFACTAIGVFAAETVSTAVVYGETAEVAENFSVDFNFKENNTIVECGKITLTWDSNKMTATSISAADALKGAQFGSKIEDGKAVIAWAGSEIDEETAEGALFTVNFANKGIAADSYASVAIAVDNFGYTEGFVAKELKDTVKANKAYATGEEFGGDMEYTSETEATPAEFFEEALLAAATTKQDVNVTISSKMVFTEDVSIGAETFVEDAGTVYVSSALDAEGKPTTGIIVYADAVVNIYGNMNFNNILYGTTQYLYTAKLPTTVAEFKEGKGKNSYSSGGCIEFAAGLGTFGLAENQAAEGEAPDFGYIGVCPDETAFAVENDVLVTKTTGFKPHVAGYVKVYAGEYNTISGNYYNSGVSIDNPNVYVGGTTNSLYVFGGSHNGSNNPITGTITLTIEGYADIVDASVGSWYSANNQIGGTGTVGGNAQIDVMTAGFAGSGIIAKDKQYTFNVTSDDVEIGVLAGHRFNGEGQADTNVKMTLSKGKYKEIYGGFIAEWNYNSGKPTIHNELYGFSELEITTLLYNPSNTETTFNTVDVYGGSLMRHQGDIHAVETTITVSDVIGTAARNSMNFYLGSRMNMSDNRNANSTGSDHSGKTVAKFTNVKLTTAGSSWAVLSGGSSMNSASKHSGAVEMTLTNVSAEKRIIGGSYLNKAGAEHSGDTLVYFDGVSNGTNNGNVLGGSVCYAANTIHSGNSKVVYKGVDATQANAFSFLTYGGSALNGAGSKHTGTSEIEVLAGQIRATMYGGSLLNTPRTAQTGDSKIKLNGELFSGCASMYAGSNAKAYTDAIAETDVKGSYGHLASSKIEFVKGYTDNIVIAGGSNLNYASDWIKEGYIVQGVKDGDTTTSVVITATNSTRDNVTYRSQIFGSARLTNGGYQYGDAIVDIDSGDDARKGQFLCVQRIAGAYLDGGAELIGNTSVNIDNDKTYIRFNGTTANTIYGIIGGAYGGVGKLTGDSSLTIKGKDAKINFYTTTTKANAKSLEIVGGCFFTGAGSEMKGNSTLTLDGVEITAKVKGTSDGDTYLEKRFIGGCYGAGTMVGNSTLKIMSDTNIDYGSNSNSTFAVIAGCYGTNNLTTAKDETTGILGGIRQTGNVEFIAQDTATIDSFVYVSGEKSNVDGDVTIRISGTPEFAQVFAALGYQAYYSSITGDLKAYISGGTFNNHFLMGGRISNTVNSTFNAKPTGANGFNFTGGNTYVEISGGTFNKQISSAGEGGAAGDKVLKFVGDKFNILTPADSGIYSATWSTVYLVPEKTGARNILDLSLVTDLEKSYKIFTRTAEVLPKIGDSSDRGFDVVYPSLADAATVAVTMNDTAFEKGEKLAFTENDTIAITYANGVTAHSGTSAGSVTTNSYNDTIAKLCEFDALASSEEAKTANAIKFYAYEEAVGEQITVVPEKAEANIAVGVGSVYSAPIAITVEGLGVAVNGTITNAAADVTVQLIQGEEVAYEATVTPVDGSAAYAFEAVAKGTYTLKVTSEGREVYTEEITVAKEDITKDVALITPKPEVVPVTFQRSMQAMLDLEDSVKMGVGYKLEGMENFDVTDEEFLSRFGLLVWKSEISEEDALITHPDAVATYGATYNADAGRFETRTNGIPAKMLGDKLWFRAFFVNEDGSYSYSRVIANYSPTTYCFNQIRDNYTNKNLVNLMASILQYGTEAQLMFNHNTDNLMIDILDGFATNATLTLTAEEIAELKSVDWDPSIVRTDFNVPDGKDSAYTKANEITTRGGNLDLEDKIGTRFYSNVNFKATSAKIYYWFESDIAGLDSLNYLENARGSADMVWSEANSRYEYLFEGRAAKEMFETIFVIMVYEDGNGNTITSGVVGYSPERFGYINGVQKTTPSTNLARATVVYGKAAKTYFG